MSSDDLIEKILTAPVHDVAIETHHRARVPRAVPFDFAAAHVMVGVIAEDIAVFSKRDAAAIRVLVIPTNEEVEIAQQAAACIQSPA